VGFRKRGGKRYGPVVERRLSGEQRGGPLMTHHPHQTRHGRERRDLRGGEDVVPVSLVRILELIARGDEHHLRHRDLSFDPDLFQGRRDLMTVTGRLSGHVSGRERGPGERCARASGPPSHRPPDTRPLGASRPASCPGIPWLFLPMDDHRVTSSFTTRDCASVWNTPRSPSGSSCERAAYRSKYSCAAASSKK